MSIPVLSADTERARRHLGGLVTVRASAEDTNGSLAVVEERAERGYSTPPHVHGREDETLFVIEGTLEYTLDGTRETATEGAAVFLPRGLPHHFAVISARAHFLVIITPGGFEQFFGQVSPPASAAGPRTDPMRMVTAAAALGTTVFTDDTTALAATRLTGTLSEITSGYRVLEHAVAGPGPLPSALGSLVDRLAEVASSRLAEHPVHARALILLGILVERGGPDVHIAVSGLLAAVRPDWPEATALAAAYLFAHFPPDAAAIEQAMRATVLREEDRARLRRCLTRRVSPDQLGRVWPSPATWTMSPAERELDRRWRASLELTTETADALWQAETTALLAYLGAKAEHAVERSLHA